MNDLAANVRHALRGFRKKPGFAVLVILTLALGIGANSALFSVVNGVLFRDLPYRDTDRLVFLANHFPETGGPESGISQAELLDWREQTDVFESVGGLGTGEQNALWTLTVDGRTAWRRSPATYQPTGRAGSSRSRRFGMSD